MIMPTLKEMVVGCFVLLVVWFFGRRRVDVVDTCHCDDAEQGRVCRNCTPPRLPR